MTANEIKYWLARFERHVASKRTPDDLQAWFKEKIKTLKEAHHEHEHANSKA